MLRLRAGAGFLVASLLLMLCMLCASMTAAASRGAESGLSRVRRAEPPVPVAHASDVPRVDATTLEVGAAIGASRTLATAARTDARVTPPAQRLQDADAPRRAPERSAAERIDRDRAPPA